MGSTLATSLLKGLDVLSIIARTENGINLQDITSSLHQPRTSVLRNLQTLETYGLVEKQNRLYFVTPLFRNWCSPGSITQLIDQFSPLMKHIATELNESAWMGIAEGTRIRHIHRIESENPIIVNINLEKRYPLETSAMGKLVLSKRDDLLAYIKDNELLSEVEQAKQTGYAWNRGETHDGIIALAGWLKKSSPLCPMISINWPAFRFSESKGAQALKLFKELI